MKPFLGEHVSSPGKLNSANTVLQNIILKNIVLPFKHVFVIVPYADFFL